MRKHEEEIGKFFDEISDEYSSIMDQMVPHYREVISAMFRFLPKEFSARSILDLGCGNGNVTALALGAFPKAEIHLVDASEDMLNACVTRFGSTIDKVELCFFQDLVLEDNTIDMIVAGFSLHHLDSLEKQVFFAKAYAALTPGGILACSDLFIDKASSEHAVLLKDWKTFCSNSGKTREDWDWLMDHYENYDRPDAFVDQEIWLRKAGFYKVELSVSKQYFGCFHAHKRC